MSRELHRELGEGLVLRQATEWDTERLAAFHGDVHRELGAEEPEEWVATWARDLMSGQHPTFDRGDFTLVEDTRSGQIVSSLCLISQTWSYEGIEFGVGRPELVGTHPDYRRRGLIRAQFEVIHGWSAERGEKLQAITGIPWFYRQFGYEMGLPLGGSRSGFKPQVPKLKDGEEDAYRVRPATEADLPFMAQLYEQGCQRYPVVCVRDAALWRYELSGKSEKNVNRRVLCVIESTDGEPVGFFGRSVTLYRNRLGVSFYETKPGVSWLAVTPSVMRHLWSQGEEWATQDPEQEMEVLFFWLGAEHPVYDVLRDQLPRSQPPYAWYVRVPDLPNFLRHVASALERRLAGSPLVGHTGAVRISFYRDGLRLVFDGGRLIAIEPWQPAYAEDGDAAFPDLTFLQLLFGYRSVEELNHAFADCWTENDAVRSLLEALFPKRPSNIWPLS